MKIKKHVRLISIIALFVSCLSTGLTAQASRYHCSLNSRSYMMCYYHHGHHRCYKHHHRRLIKKRHLALERASDQKSALTNSMRHELIRDINYEREGHNVRPLKPAIIPQSASDYRIRHVLFAYENPNDRFFYHKSDYDDWVHGFDTHTTYFRYLIKHHILNKYSAENAADFQVGPEEQSDGTWPPYSNNTPHGIADNIDNDFMYHDVADGNHNAHRDSELNPHYKYIGVSVKYDKARNHGAIVENFLS